MNGMEGGEVGTTRGEGSEVEVKLGVGWGRGVKRGTSKHDRLIT